MPGENFARTSWSYNVAAAVDGFSTQRLPMIGTAFRSEPVEAGFPARCGRSAAGRAGSVSR
ncbi:hypothetical protein IV500_01440 [Paeniglutamicibacter antarcticus]|uniref:Uncharacterized protein n=1 Tax=Arthrobacter terrae TaxID=2935737 RepID=A0A931CR57_9MICC|nr:hypothetical protein [Arthrobacter terrae]MBG0738098.1 hypothetical protein [Arthrobacter terrae]